MATALAVASLVATTVAPEMVGAATAIVQPAPDAAGTVWLCRPGQSGDPCATDLTITDATFSGKVTQVVHAHPASDPKVDCFYVYPTVSDESGPNADLTVDPQEQSIAIYQAAMFSRVCRVYAPMYRQLTLTNISGAATPAQQALAYDSMASAWKDYLAHDNHGRGFILIGHSQGSFLLRTLIAKEIDSNATVRKHLVSAILLGGNVLVKKGSEVGGDFHHIPGCRSGGQTGCVIAYSTFDATPPSDSVFGRTTAKGMEVLCTNPAALSGGSGALDPLLPSAPFAPGSSIAAGIALLGIHAPSVTTAWLGSPGAYSASCSNAGGAEVLRVTAEHGAPTLHYSPLPTWGLHLVDMNIALGNLIAIITHQVVTYEAHHSQS